MTPKVEAAIAQLMSGSAFCDHADIRTLISAYREAERDAAYFKHRLQTIIPLFEEARDALPAITLASAKLRGLDLSLGARMDEAGTYCREQWDAAIAKGGSQ